MVKRGKKVYGKARHREEFFFTTDVTMPAKAIAETYGARWNIETTFQEMRSHLGLATTRGWSRQTMLRMAPCWFVLYTIVVVFHDALRAQRNATPRIEPLTQWNGKQHVAFADTIAQVRRYLWQAWVFQHVARRPPSPKTTARDPKTATLRTLPSSMRMEKVELTAC